MKNIAIYSSIILCTLSLGIHAGELEQNKLQAEAEQFDQDDNAQQLQSPAPPEIEISEPPQITGIAASPN